LAGVDHQEVVAQNFQYMCDKAQLDVMELQKLLFERGYSAEEKGWTH